MKADVGPPADAMRDVIDEGLVPPATSSRVGLKRSASLRLLRLNKEPARSRSHQRQPGPLMLHVGREGLCVAAFETGDYEQ